MITGTVCAGAVVIGIAVGFVVAIWGLCAIRAAVDDQDGERG